MNKKLKEICGKYSIEEVADKAVEYFKMYDDINKEIPEFPMIIYVFLAFGTKIDRTNKQEVIEFLREVINKKI